MEGHSDWFGDGHVTLDDPVRGPGFLISHLRQLFLLLLEMSKEAALGDF